MNARPHLVHRVGPLTFWGIDVKPFPAIVSALLAALPGCGGDDADPPAMDGGAMALDARPDARRDARPPVRDVGPDTGSDFCHVGVPCNADRGCARGDCA